MLGVSVQGSVLPALVRCPLCQRQSLTVYKEPAKPGHWYHCTGCGFAGDPVDLTAAAGQISVGSAILKLVARGLPIPPNLLEPEKLDLQEKKAAFRKQVLAFWDTARASTSDIGGTGPAQRKLGIAPGMMHAPEWPRRGGRFVGHCPVIEAEKLLRPGVLAYRLKHGMTGVGGVGWAPLFPGRGWRDLLVVAYRDVPGRISGLMFIGREAHWPEDFVFAPILTFKAGVPYAIGVSMLDAALTMHREFGSTVVVVEDPVMALRIQLRHLVNTDTFLPVVGAWGRREFKSIWPILPRRNLVHWSPEPNGQLLTRARLADGQVALAPAGQAVAGHLERSRPILAVQGMVAAARPWDAALEALLSQLAPAKAEELVLGLKLKPDETAGFLRACADDTRARLAALFTDVGKPRGVTISGKTVIESCGAWRVSSTGELVCDAILRIDQVIRSAGGAVSYRGRIEYKGQSLPFWAPDSEIEKNTLRWLKTKVGQAGLGEVIIGGTYWSRFILNIAQQLEPPQSIHGLDMVGWDDDRNAFALPQFILRGNGEVVAPDYVVPAETIMPGSGLTMPDGMTPGARVALAWSDEANELFWAATVCLLTDILSPALGMPRSSTALVGAGAVGAGQAVARAFGCLEAYASGGYHKRGLAVAAQRLLDQGHRWPLLMIRHNGLSDDPAGVVHAETLGTIQPGVVAAAGSWPAEVLSVTGGWHVLMCSNSVTTDRVREHGATVLVNYLKDLCERRLDLDVGGSLLDAVHRDLAAWYGRVASSRVVDRARQYIYADDPTARSARFGRLVCRLIDSGELRLSPPGANAQRAIIVLGGDLVHIPKWGVNESLAKRLAIALDVDAISLSLRSSGVLLEERDQDYVAGWVVPESWLRQHMDDRRHDDRFDLSVAK